MLNLPQGILSAPTKWWLYCLAGIPAHLCASLHNIQVKWRFGKTKHLPDTQTVCHVILTWAVIQILLISYWRFLTIQTIHVGPKSSLYSLLTFIGDSDAHDYRNCHEPTIKDDKRAHPAMVQEQSALVRLLVEAGELEPRPSVRWDQQKVRGDWYGLMGLLFHRKYDLNGDSYSTNNPVWWSIESTAITGGVLAWQTGSRRTSHGLAKKWKMGSIHCMYTPNPLNDHIWWYS
jgi:hypothetical protein